MCTSSKFAFPVSLNPENLRFIIGKWGKCQILKNISIEHRVTDL